ncbi:PKD domain-containing protein [Microbacterium tumbae]
MLRSVASIATAALIVTGLTVLSGQAAVAADDPPQPPPLLQRDDDVVTADAIPTVQIDNGYVWAQATIGSTVYAVGKFDNAKAPLAAPGTQLTPRSNVLAYDINSGALLPFAPTVNGVVKSVAASPDGTRIYIGGSFTQVNGQTRYSFAALDATTGQLVPGFSPSVGGSGVYAITVSGSTVYVGGLFSQANGTARKNLAAFNAANGALLPWAPQSDLQTDALIMDPDGQDVIVAGRFSQVNGDTSMRGTAAVDKLTGELDTAWAVPQTVKNGRGSGGNAGKAGIFTLAADDDAVYGTGWVFADAATGNLEGTFAAEAGTGQIRWIADCLGDHYGVYSTGETVYTTSHTHACSTLGLAPEQNPRTHRFLEAYTADARGTLGYQPATGSTYVNWQGTPAPSPYAWYPDMAVGNTTGLGQAGLSITGVGEVISVAGEFRAVNNLQFEGIVRFSTTPPGGAKDRPRLTGASWVPSALSLIPGRARVSVQANWDRDDKDLTYELRRSGTSAPVATLSASSTWWNRPSLTLEDTTATPGAQYTYTVVAKDGDGNTATSQAVSVTVADGEASEYVNAIIDDSPQLYYPLGDTDQDWAGANKAVFGSGVSSAASGIENSSTGRSNLNGTSNGRIVSSSRVAASREFSTELWFRTTSTNGGKLIGYGDAASGNSGSYDRHVYIRDNGQLVFGVYPGSAQTIQSGTGYNDGQWHHVVASQSAQGIRLYVDGQLAASNASVTSAQDYLGYWRIGGDNLGGWPSTPSSSYLDGSIDEVAVYDYALSANQVGNHYGIGKGFAAPTAAFTATSDGADASFDAGDSAAAGSATITGYSWDFGDESPAGSGETVSHTYATSGAYTVTLTVTDSNGRTAKTQQQIDVLGPNALPEAAFTSTTSGLTATVDASGSNDSDGAIASYEWDWGDDSADGEGQVASHAYAESGTYPVTLTVTDDRGAAAELTQDVVVTHADPVARFDASASGLAVTVDGSDSTASDGAELSYDWDWGDDSAHGEGATAEHPYTEDGDYEITLTVTDSLGSSHSTSQSFMVTADVFAASDAFNRAVSSGWGSADKGGVWTVTGGSATVATVGDGVGRLNIAVGGTRELVLASTSILDSESRVTYTLQNGPASGILYAGVGARRGDQGGYRAAAWHRADGSTWLVIQRNGTAIASVPLSGVTWSAGSTFHLATEVAGSSPTTIKAKLWADGSAEPANWQLQTTDSTAALQVAGAATVYGYRSASGAGANAMSFDDFTVKDLAAPVAGNAPPVASFTSSVSGLSVSVDGAGSSDEDGSIASYAWDFGDDATGSGATASHDYASAGTYTVTLTVTDDDGATHSTSEEITATAPVAGNAPPVASFTSSVSGLSVSVDGAGSSDEDGSIASYAWDFGDDSTGSGATASHDYASAGTYTVTLTVTDDDGATHSTSEEITVEGAEEPSGPLVQDEFDRSATSSWGTAPTGGAWTVTGGSAAVASVADGAAKLALAAGGTRHVTLNGTAVADSVIETRFRVNPGAESGGSYVGVVARQSGDDRYLVRAWLRPDGTVWLVAHRGSTLLASQPLAGVTYSPDTVYNLKVSVAGASPTTLSAKFWADGATEPATWQLTTTDSTAALQGAGSVGLSGYRTGTATATLNLLFESFTVNAPE